MPCLVETWPDYDPHVLSEIPVLGVSTLRSIDLDGRVAPAVQARELFDVGVRRLRVVEPTIINDDSEEFLWWIALLGNLAGRGIVVDWNLEWSSARSDLDRLTHLPAPREFAGPLEHSDLLGEWIASWELLRLAERRGPAFIRVHDKRSLPSSRFVIDNPGELTGIERLRTPARVSEDDELVREMDANGLVLIRNGFALWLPVPLLRWPIVARGAYA